MATFLTSDLHLGHANIIRYCRRPFADVASMDQGLVERWNAVVGDDDEVWVLGDVALGPIERSLDHVRRLRGRKHLVAGNHDRVWSGYGAKAARWVPRYRAVGFETIVHEARLDVGGHEVLLSHFPYRGDSQGVDRHVEHRPRDRGLVVLHGHVHDAWAEDGRQINVGVDVRGYAPVPVEALVPLVEAALAAGP